MSTENETPPRQFRLDEGVMEQLDRIAEGIGQRGRDGKPNRTAALKYAVAQAAKKFPKKSS